MAKTEKGTEHAKRPSATKRGPGRYHSAGHERVTATKAKGAPAGFVQHTNLAANRRRIDKAAIGARQFRKVNKLARRIERAEAERPAQ